MGHSWFGPILHCYEKNLLTGQGVSTSSIQFGGYTADGFVSSCDAGF